MMVSPRFLRMFKVLILMTVGLMALGAGVRTMNAGLACPDWPLCFGQVVPDFHVGVWFEFVHRAYAGMVALLFFGCLIYLFRRQEVTKPVRALGLFALLVLILQIVMGGLTVLKLLHVSVVTSHLMLATLFAATLFVMAGMMNPAGVKVSAERAPAWFAVLAKLFPAAVFGQIWLGGLVASSYAGSVCVDFPLCNGLWVPTLSGPIGFQVLHRFGAYALALFALVIAVVVHRHRRQAWMTRQALAMSRMLIAVVLVQVGVGIANLLFYIPAWLTVIHQSMAVLILLSGLRLAFIAHRLSRDQALGVSGWDSGAARLKASSSIHA